MSTYTIARVIGVSFIPEGSYYTHILFEKYLNNSLMK